MGRGEPPAHEPKRRSVRSATERARPFVANLMFSRRFLMIQID